MIFLMLLFVPVLIAIGFFIFGGKKITWQEFLIHIGVQIAVVSICLGVVYYSNTTDVEIWNGVVSAKQRQVVSCRHSYSCNCVEVCSGGKDNTCTEVCQTCYEHNYDVDWDYWTTDNGGDSVDTIDRQGLREPPRWTRIYVGEPTSSTHIYTNYIKAAEGTLFKSQGLVDQYKQYLPKYPNKIYDYYMINKVVLVNNANVDVVAYNNFLRGINAELGAKKQVNIVLVFVKDLQQDYFYALEQYWIGGKKNDFIVVVGINDAQEIKWATIMAWTNNEIVKVKTRDDLLKLGSISSPNDFMFIVQENVNNYYVRKPMKDFAYLKYSITPTTTELVVSFIISVIVSIGLGWYFMVNDFFSEENKYARRY